MRKTHSGLSNNKKMSFSVIQTRNPTLMGLSKALLNMFRDRLSAFQHNLLVFVGKKVMPVVRTLLRKLSVSLRTAELTFISPIYCLTHRNKETSRMKVKTQLESIESKTQWNNKQASSFLGPNTSLKPKQYSISNRVLNFYLFGTLSSMKQ